MSQCYLYYTLNMNIPNSKPENIQNMKTQILNLNSDHSCIILELLCEYIFDKTKVRIRSIQELYQELYKISKLPYKSTSISTSTDIIIQDECISNELWHILSKFLNIIIQHSGNNNLLQ